MSRLKAWLVRGGSYCYCCRHQPTLDLECRQPAVENDSHEVASLYPHTRNVHWDFGFYCPHAVQSGSRPHPARCYGSKVKPQHVICSIQDCRGGPVGLENRHKCWFTVSIYKVLFSEYSIANIIIIINIV